MYNNYYDQLPLPSDFMCDIAMSVTRQLWVVLESHALSDQFASD